MCHWYILALLWFLLCFLGYILARIEKKHRDEIEYKISRYDRGISKRLDWIIKEMIASGTISPGFPKEDR